MYVLCTFKMEIESQNWEFGCIKDQQPYPNQNKDDKPQSGSSRVLQSPIWGLKWHWCSLHLQNQDRAKIQIIGVSKTSDHIQIKIKMPNPSQEPPASSKFSNNDLKVRGQFNEYLPIREFYKMVNFRDHFEIKFYVLTSPPPPLCYKVPTFVFF